MSQSTPLRRASGRLTFRAIDRARAAIDKAMALDPDWASEIFTRFDAAKIMRAAEAVDADRTRSGGTLAGMMVSIKDLFDEEGEITTAGSIELAHRPPATRDAEVVRRLVASGAIPFGRTSMSEFAYSGVGLNPHFGTPGNSRDRSRIPGGSTSGGAVTVGLGLADVALGSDTGGSIRIPAALNGLAGFKPTQAAVPLDGSFPLSPTYDSFGPLAHDIPTCAAVHAALSGSPRPHDTTPRRPRIGVLRTVLSDGLDTQVAADFQAALEAVGAAGAELVDVALPEIAEAGPCNRIIVARDAHRIHASYLDALETTGDPRVLRRIRAAEGISDEEEQTAHSIRAAAKAAFERLAEGFDAFVAPTVSVVAPTIAEVEAEFDSLNALILRNPSSINFLDGCAATVPMQAHGTLPTGLMIFGPAGADWTILAIAERFEPIVAER